MKNAFGTLLMLICFSGFIASPAYAAEKKAAVPRKSKQVEKSQMEQEVGQKLVALSDRVRVLEQQATRLPSPQDVPAAPPYSYP